jgi:signal peptidase I
MNAENDVKCHLAAETLRQSGKLRLQVMGWSMLPTIWPGDVVIIERAKILAVSQGDIVLFGREQRFFVHRIVKKATQEPSGLLTQGDAMDAPDPPVQEHELLGRVSLIVRNGRCIQPKRELNMRDKAVAGLVRFSDTSARVIVGLHGFIRNH